MAGLEGTIKTPMGTVSKKTALLIGGGVVIVGGIVWYRQKQAADATPATTEAEINPATGYPYGSAEDAAALAEQSAYVSPTVSTSGGSSTIPPSNLSYSSNGQWVQAVVTYMLDNGLVSDGAALSAALGKYTTGAYIAVGSTDESLVQQAIAVEGYPPIAGTNGYPPSINRTPPVTSTPTANPNVTNVQGLHLASSTSTTLTFAWSYGTVKPDFQLVYKDNVPVANIAGSTLTMTLKNLKPNTTYKFQVRGIKGNPGVQGPSAAATGKTKAK